MIRAMAAMSALSLAACASGAPPVAVAQGAAAADGAACAEGLRGKFDDLNGLGWRTAFEMPQNADWRDHWFLDGEQAKVTYRDRVLDFAAGPVAWDDASHAVLWTRDSFAGDLKIEYDWTKLDEARGFVNILYIQATGEPSLGYGKDILAWADDRRVPAMSSYFRRMNTLHISYSALANDDQAGASDYVRARRYDPAKAAILRGTDLEPDYFGTGLFGETGKPHRITVIKHGDDLFFDVVGAGRSCLFYWRLSQAAPITEGRIGLRHMYTRRSSYAGFKVSTLATNQD
jgi:hypothetical protein